MKTGIAYRVSWIAVLGACLFTSPVAAQFSANGEVLVANDYRNSASTAIVVKWFAHKVYYKDGFNVYRKAEGESAWTKLNDRPLKVQSSAPAALAQRDEELNAFLNIVNKTPYEEFQEGLPKVFVVIKAIMSPEFAELLGIIYYDETAAPSVSYQYQVRGLIGSKEETVGTSKAITRGVFRKELPPQDIRITRKPDRIEINWKPEELRYYGVNIYRSANGQKWKRVTRQPRNIFKSEDKNGNETYPEVFFIDENVSSDTAYQYKFTVTDYFGQEGEFSKPFPVTTVDFEAPPAPLDLRFSVNVLDITLSWTPQPSDDLAGFKVYRSAHADSAMTAISELLPKNQHSFVDHLLKTGGYYYVVAAVDNKGNEGLSQKIFTEVRDVIPPRPPTNVAVKSDTGRVVLTWDRNTEPDLRGYYVYRSLYDGDQRDNEFVVVNPTPIKGNSYTEILPRNVRNKFVYGIVAEDLSYNRSPMSQVSVVHLPDVTPPGSPVIKNIFGDGGNLVVEWLPSGESDVRGYNIFRSTDTVRFTRINKNPYPATSFRYTDTQVAPNQRYYYYVQAVDSAGNASSPSNIFTAVSRQEAKGAAPEKVTVEYAHARKGIKLSWTLPASPQIVGAVVFRSLDKVNFRPVTGILKENSFTDRAIKKGVTYYYQVRSYTSAGTVEPSAIFETTVTE